MLQSLSAEADSGIACLLRTVVQLLDWELIGGFASCELGFEEYYEVKLTLKDVSGEVFEKTIPVLAVSKRFVITAQGVLCRGQESKEGCKDMLTFEEFLQVVDP